MFEQYARGFGMAVEHGPTEGRPGMPIVNRGEIGPVMKQGCHDIAMAEPSGFMKRRHMFAARRRNQFRILPQQTFDRRSIAQFHGGK